MHAPDHRAVARAFVSVVADQKKLGRSFRARID